MLPQPSGNRFIFFKMPNGDILFGVDTADLCDSDGRKLSDDLVND